MTDGPQPHDVDEEAILDSLLMRQARVTRTNGPNDQNSEPAEPATETLEVAVVWLGDPAHTIEVAKWVSTAVASGLVGNLAYDTLKVALRRGTRRPDKSVDAEGLLSELVFHAIIEQCRRYELRVPDPQHLRITKWIYGDVTATASVVSLESELTAEVTIPTHHRELYKVEVRIRDVSQRKAIEKAARRDYVQRFGRPKRLSRNRLVVVLLLGVLAFVSAVTAVLLT